VSSAFSYLRRIKAIIFLITNRLLLHSVSSTFDSFFAYLYSRNQRWSLFQSTSTTYSNCTKSFAAVTNSYELLQMNQIHWVNNLPNLGTASTKRTINGGFSENPLRVRMVALNRRRRGLIYKADMTNGMTNAAVIITSNISKQ
jgi:hypothetical protein